MGVCIENPPNLARKTKHLAYHFFSQVVVFWHSGDQSQGCQGRCRILRPSMAAHDSQQRMLVKV